MPHELKIATFTPDCFSIFPILTWGTESPSTADSIRISLLTCAPGEEIYSLFGHTAIRYEEPARGIDRVYNYGLFSFNTPNFTLRFALGNADYRLGVEDYRHFAVEYEYFGRSVWQQTLNLTAEEQQQLITLLEENYRPENRIYRYNFFYDNCATRPRDKVEESLQKVAANCSSAIHILKITRLNLIGILSTNTRKDIPGHNSESISASAARPTAPSAKDK